MNAPRITDTVQDTDSVRACDASLADAMRVMAAFQDGARVVSDPSGLAVVGRSRFPSPYSNAAFPTDASVDPLAFLAFADRTFSDRRYFLWARGALSRALEGAAEAGKLAPFGELPGMVIEERLAEPKVPGVSVSRVLDQSAFDDFVAVSQLAYAEAGLPAPIALSLLASASRAIAVADLFVSRVDGVRASAALSITSLETGVGGVYWVGTLPEARRRGAAEAVTRAVTNAAFDRGARIVTLQASVAGAPLYLRLGYREVVRYARFLSPALPSGAAG